jgi:putative oxidoreductase
MIGFDFAAHGWAKISRGPESFAVILSALGVPQPHLMAWVTPLVELVGGLTLMAGAFVVPLTLPLAVVLLTAIFTVHLPYGFSSVRLIAVTPHGPQFGPIGYEMDLLYLAGLLTLALGGAGKLSIDDWRKMRRQKSGKAEHSDHLSIGPLKLKLRI